MSTKEAHGMNHWYHMLTVAETKEGGAVTAGQVAKEAGTARSTARRWLEKLVLADAAMSNKYIGRNSFHEIRFQSSETF